MLRQKHRKNKYLILILLSVLCLFGCIKKEQESEYTEKDDSKQVNIENENREDIPISIDLPQDLSDEISKGYSIYGVIEQKNYTAVLFVKNDNKHDLLIGNFIFLIIVNNDLLDYKVVFSNSTYRPIFYDDECIAISFFNTTNYKSEIEYFDIKYSKIHSILTEDRYIGEIFCYKDFIYYSTEMSKSAIKRIKVETMDIVEFEEYNLINASFFVNDDIVYACYNDLAYKIGDDFLSKTDNICNAPNFDQRFADMKKGDINSLRRSLNINEKSIGASPE